MTHILQELRPKSCQADVVDLGDLASRNAQLSPMVNLVRMPISLSILIVLASKRDYGLSDSRDFTGDERT